ncbi:MAG: T9SS type A sorting domain-containing protein, partial [bacterium]
FNTDTNFVGYIFGGISSTAANIFFTNNGTQSIASNQIFKVYVVKNNSVGIDHLNKQSIGTLKMQVYPNPSDGDFTVKFNLIKEAETKISIYRIDGKKIEEKIFDNFKVGENIYSKKIRNLEDGGHYFITIETAYESATQKIIIE